MESRTWVASVALLMMVWGWTCQTSCVGAEGTAAMPEVGQKRTCWVRLKSRAELRMARSYLSEEARGDFVVGQLKATAEQSQAGLRAFLRGRGAAHKAFWIANVLRVTADEATLRQLAERPEVERILPEEGITFRIPEFKPRPADVAMAGPEWNVSLVSAPEVWQDFHVTGKGVVVGVIDTGFAPIDPLLSHYRGNRGRGRLDHNYSWFDVTDHHTTAPVDEDGHGTHVTGTIVGGDGPRPLGDDVGVAPGAKFISCKAFLNNQGSFEGVLAAMQWMLAPTDLNGENPRPSLRPHIVNNSWSSMEPNRMVADAVDAWVAAGIFPVFAVGNWGPSCGSVQWPAAYCSSFAVGSLTIDRTMDPIYQVAISSGVGPGENGIIKPDVMAGGEEVRSYSTDGSLVTFSGTSMSAPAVSGVVALVYSAAPRWRRHVEETMELVRGTADARQSMDCSNQLFPNNAYGYGTVDGYGAVLMARGQSPSVFAPGR